MYYCWYTIVVIIRTFRGQISEGNALVSFTVIDHQAEVIIIDIDGIDEGFDDVAAEGRIIPVAFCEAMEEEENTITIHQLGLGEAERLTGDAEVFSIRLKFLQLFHGGG